MTNKRTRSARFAATITLVALGNLGWTVSSADDVASEISEQFAGLSYIETLTAGADGDTELPMLIALHYMSGSAATSIEDYGGVDAPVRLLSLEGPHKLEEGFSWFPDGYYELDAGLQLDITIDIANRIASFIREATQAFPTRGKPILTGYSQGADLTHMIALREPGLIQAGLPMGGRFPEMWWDAATGNTELPAEIVLFHGAADTAVDVSESFAAARYYTGKGVTVVLHTYAGAGHSYPAQMKSDFENIIKRLLQSPVDSD